MNPQLIFFLVLALLLFIVILMDIKYNLLRDQSILAVKKPYSFSRIQLTWWTFIVFAALITIVCASGKIPTFDQSTLVLLGISSLTTASAKIIDLSDESNAAAVNAASAAAGTPAPAARVVLSRNLPGENLFLDILSDKNGISIHRFQAVVFNLIFGLWFLYKVFINIKGIGTGTVMKDINGIIPHIEQNNLILLGLSAGTYAALKITENK